MKHNTGLKSVKKTILLIFLDVNARVTKKKLTSIHWECNQPDENRR